MEDVIYLLQVLLLCSWCFWIRHRWWCLQINIESVLYIHVVSIIEMNKFPRCRGYTMRLASLLLDGVSSMVCAVCGAGSCRMFCAGKSILRVEFRRSDLSLMSSIWKILRVVSLNDSSVRRTASINVFDTSFMISGGKPDLLLCLFMTASQLIRSSRRAMSSKQKNVP